tara:strand:- start:63 stop:311 length:249 start_codon:yes stop_codon:yes gene_type:complete
MSKINGQVLTAWMRPELQPPSVREEMWAVNVETGHEGSIAPTESDPAIVQGTNADDEYIIEWHGQVYRVQSIDLDFSNTPRK